MGYQSRTEGRKLKIANSQKKRMITPDVILHTKNVMIPVIKPVPIKQSFNIVFPESRPQILKAQNYRNNPVLLLSEPSHTLNNHMENSFEVKRFKHWKSKNKNTKYTISGKTDSINIQEINALQNSYLSKRSSFKKNDNIQILHFPNIFPAQRLENDKELRKTSSKFIQLSRKCNLLIKESQVEDKDKSAIMPIIEMPISNVTSKPQIVSLPSESFYNTVDTVSTVSTPSVSDFNIDNKKMYANIGNWKKSESEITSDHLHLSNSEYEINVLHYENDISSENKFPCFASSYSKSSINRFSTENLDIDRNRNSNKHLGNERTTIKENYQYPKVNKAICDTRYSWQSINDLVLPFQKKEYKNQYGIRDLGIYGAKPYDCKIKYSWQAIGTSTQTSYSLLQHLLDDKNVENHKSAYKMCSIKYSWQIIGMSTQVSLHNFNDANYWSGILLTANKNYNENNSQIINNKTDCIKSQDYTKYPEGKLKKYLILNNQHTQTFAEKDVQADVNDQYTKYSWHSLLKRYL